MKKHGVLILALGILVGVGFWIGPRWARRARQAELQALLNDVKTIETNRYVIVFPKIYARGATLAAAADEIHDLIQPFIGAPFAGRIPVRLTALTNLVGHTYDRQVTLDIGPLDRTKRVLGHETVHVYLNALAGDALQRHRDGTRLFNEGVATYAECRLLGRECSGLEQMAAAYRARGPVSLGTLLEGRGAIRDFGARAAYPLGLVFIRALVEGHGEAAIPLLARTMRDLHPAEGQSFVVAAFGAAGLDFAAVERRFDAQLTALLDENRAAMARLPALVAQAKLEAGRVVVNVIPTTPVSGFMRSCSFRRPGSNQAPEVHLAEECATAQGRFPEQPLEVQLCWAGEDGETDLCEPYRAVVVP